MVYIISIDPGEVNIGVATYCTLKGKLVDLRRVCLRKGKRALTRQILGRKLRHWMAHYQYYNKDTICLSETQLERKYIYFNGVLLGIFGSRYHSVSPAGRNRFIGISLLKYSQRKKRAVEICEKATSGFKGKKDDIADAYLQLKYWLHKNDYDMDL